MAIVGLIASLPGRAGGLKAAATTQQIRADATPQQPVFRSGTRLVVETVSVKDKNGKPIEGLTVKDFAITEDGEPQTVSFVEFQRLESAPNSAPVDILPAPGAAAAAPAGAPAAPPQISISAPGDTRYRDRKLMVLYFDMTALPPADLARACTAARKYVDTEMTSTDLLAIMTFKGGAVRVKQDFTSNRAQLRDVLQDVLFGEDKDGDGIPDPEPGTAFGQDDGSSVFSAPIASCRRCKLRSRCSARCPSRSR